MKDSAQLPLFQGQEPSATTFSLTGKITTANDQPAKPMHLGHQVILVVVGTVKHVGFDDEEDAGPVMGTKVKAEQAYWMTNGVEANELVGRLFAENRKTVNRRLGLPDEPEEDNQPAAARAG